MIPKTSYGDCWAAETITKWPLRHVQHVSPQGLFAESRSATGFQSKYLIELPRKLPEVR